MKTTATICCLVGIGLGAYARPAYAQQPEIPLELTLDAALRIALEWNPAVAAAGSAVRAAEGTRVDASRPPVPALSVESEGYPLFESSRASFFGSQELTVRMDLEIETAGRRRLRIAVAAGTVAVAEALLADERRRVAATVRHAYLAGVLATADLRVAEATLEEIDRVIAINRARLNAGEISGVDVRRLHMERLRFVEDVFASELALRNATSALLALLNARDLGVPVELTESLAAPAGAAALQARDALETRAMAVRPDLAAARYGLQQAESQTRLQRAVRSPNVTVGGGYRRDFGSDAVVVGVTVPLQIFNRNQGGVQRAEAERQRASHLVDAAATQVRLDVQQAVNAVDVSAERVRYIEREHLLDAEQTREAVLASYRLGAADLIDLLDAQRAFRDTVRTYNRALYEHRLSLLQLEAAVGETPPAASKEE
jgi:cobalt-zinc-cadmium efflux system outer membrane protein